LFCLDTPIYFPLTLIQFPLGKTGTYITPDSVTSIGFGAFGGCTGLTSVTIPNRVTSIGDYAFLECTGLTSACFLGNAPSMGKSVFDYCDPSFIVLYINGKKGFTNLWYGYETGMKNGDYIYSVTNSEANIIRYTGTGGDLVIPAAFDEYTVTGIGDGAFSNCDGLTIVAIPNIVTSIGDNTFINCTGLTSVTIGTGVTSIGYDAFYGCTGLTQFIVDGSNPSYSSQDGVLFDKEKTNIIQFPLGKTGTYIIPNSVTSIGDNTFIDCTGLTSVTIGTGVTSIGGSAFEGCTGLTSVTIGTGVTSIGDNAFGGCTGLTQFIVDGSNPSYSSQDGVVFDKEKTTIIQFPLGKTGTYTIPGSVTSIGYYAFMGCTGLTSVNIPNSVTSIGDEAFSECTGLTSVTIGTGVTSIGDKAFDGCTDLISVTIPNSVTSIGDCAFNGCTGLISINVVGDNTEYASDNGVLFNKTQTELIQYPCGKTGAYTIPTSVTSIGGLAFYGCAELTFVNIPNSVTSIGDEAFIECTGLTSVTIPPSVTSIGEGAFYCCTGLTSITIPNSVTSIGDSAFDGCTGLISVTIPSSVTSIEESAFVNCTGLTSVTIGTGVTSIGNWAFDGCTSLTSVTIPNSVTSIGDCAFNGCTDLTSVTIPNSVTSIGDYAFADCTGLTIYCYTNSYAQTYAIANSIPYDLIHFSTSSTGPGCIIDYANNYIYDFNEAITSLDGYFDTGTGYELLYIPTAQGYGTGTVVNVVSTEKNASPNSVIASYTVVIYGDVNGDGNIDSIDAGNIVDFQNYMINWDPVTDAALYKAGDLNGDGNVDSIDAGLAVDAQNYMVTIDQSTGLAIPN